MLQEPLSAPIIIVEANLGNLHRCLSFISLGHLTISHIHSKMIDRTSVAEVARIENEITSLQVRLVDLSAVIRKFSFRGSVATDRNSVCVV